MATKQTNLCANPSRGLIFFEGECLCYNYKTSQWSRLPAYSELGMYGVNDKAKDVGLVIYSSGSVDLQDQANSDPAQTAIISTSSIDINTGGRTTITGVRPLVNGGTVTVQAGSKDSISGTTNWSAATSVNSRSGVANLRHNGRYMSVSVTIADGFNDAMGADVEFSPSGRV